MKILLFVDELFHAGVQSMLLDFSPSLTRNGHTVELLTLDNGKSSPLEDKFTEMGVVIHKLDNIWFRNIFTFFELEKALDVFFRNHHDYDVCHVNSGPKNYAVNKYAKKYGVPVRIFHSHNTGYTTTNSAAKVLGNILKREVKRYSNGFFAVTEEAAEWMYGKLTVNVTIMPSPVDQGRFSFRQHSREQSRKELGIEDAFVIGNVNRMERQKNYRFLLLVFSALLEMRPDSVLLIVGSGSEEAELRELARQKAISDKVLFLGYKENRELYLNGMDVFVMPSLYEGFSLSLLEAQTNGLPCVISKDVIPSVSKVNPNCVSVPLSASAQIWAAAIIANDQRYPSIDLIAKSDYNIKVFTNKALAAYDEILANPN